MTSRDSPGAWWSRVDPKTVIAYVLVITVALVVLLSVVKEKPIEIPKELWTLLTLIIGFYFGEKRREIQVRRAAEQA